MSLPAVVRHQAEERLGPLQERGTVGGGCIHPALRLATGNGDIFLKYGRGTSPGFFATEAAGLRNMAGAVTRLRIPEVLAYADAPDARSFGWLALEWLESGARGGDFSVRLAEGLTELHGATAAGWGWDRNGFIGTLPQENAPAADWPTFWLRRRLQPQLEMTRANGRLPATEREWAVLFERLPELLKAGDDDGPSLLHGDLWGGNILANASGTPALVDPAVYRGHREVDLAMSELFGGLDPAFYEAYDAARPLRGGYREARRGIYQLYYLLVHVNLFGDGYVAHTAATLRSVLSSR